MFGKRPLLHAADVGVHDAVCLGAVAPAQRGQNLAMLGDCTGRILDADPDEESEALPVAAQGVIGAQQSAVVGVLGDQAVKFLVGAVILPDGRGVGGVRCPVLLLDSLLQGIQPAGIGTGTG